MRKILFKDKRLSLLVLCLATALYTFICMTKYCFSSAMVYIVAEGYMTKFETGTIVSAFWAVYAATQVAGGIAADKWEPKSLITIGLVGAGLSNLAVYFLYDSYILTVIIWSLNAAFQFAVWPACFKIISSMIAPSHRSRGMVIITLSYPAGILLSYLVAGLISRWQMGFIVSAVGLFIMAIVWEIGMGYAMRNAEDDSVRLLVPEGNLSDAATPTKSVPFSRLVISSGLIIILVVSFMRSLINQMQTLVPTMINESYDGVDPSFATLLSLIVLFCSAAGPVFGNLFAKYIKNEMLISSVFIGCMIPMGAVTLLLGKISYWYILAAVAVIMLLTSATSFYVTTLVATKYNKWGKSATVAGILNAFSAFGVVGANFALTLIAEKLGWLMTLITVSVLIVVAFILAVTVTPIWKKFKKNNNIT